MNNNYLFDDQISLKAKGLLHFLHSMPEDFEMSAKAISSYHKDCKDAVNNGLQELEKSGYLIRIKKTRADGKFGGYVYNFK